MRLLFSNNDSKLYSALIIQRVILLNKQPHYVKNLDHNLNKNQKIKAWAKACMTQKKETSKTSPRKKSIFIYLIILETTLALIKNHKEELKLQEIEIKKEYEFMMNRMKNKYESRIESLKANLKEALVHKKESIKKHKEIIIKNSKITQNQKIIPLNNIFNIYPKAQKIVHKAQISSLRNKYNITNKSAQNKFEM